SRRSGAWKTLALVKNARRRMAKVCQPANVLRLDVRAPRQKAALHGRRVWPVARMEPRSRPGLAFNRTPAARRTAASRATSELHLQTRARFMGAGRQS